MFEIILFALGIIFIVLSFFIGNTDKEKASEQETARFSFPQEELDRAQQRVSEEIGLVSQNAITDTANQLSTMSNETIIFVDDFARQTLERLQHNHDEVVFMYNMLQTKEEELKATERNIVIENEKLAKQKEELENMLIPKISEGSGIEMARRKSSGEKEAEKKRLQKAEPAAPVIEAPIVDASEFSNEDEESKTQKILELYRQKKSVLDISKQLGLGQGEVKLVIDLYGRA